MDLYAVTKKGWTFIYQGTFISVRAETVKPVLNNLPLARSRAWEKVK